MKKRISKNRFFMLSMFFNLLMLNSLISQSPYKQLLKVGGLSELKQYDSYTGNSITLGLDDPNIPAAKVHLFQSLSFTPLLMLEVSKNFSIQTLFQSGSKSYGIYQLGPENGVNYLQNRLGINTDNPLDNFQVNDGIEKVAIGTGCYINWYHETPLTTIANSYIGFNAVRDKSRGPATWLFSTDQTHNGGNAIIGDASGNLHFVNIPTTGSTNQSISDYDLPSYETFTVGKKGNVVINSTETPRIAYWGYMDDFNLTIFGGHHSYVMSYGLDYSAYWASTNHGLIGLTTDNGGTGHIDIQGTGSGLPGISSRHILYFFSNGNVSVGNPQKDPLDNLAVNGKESSVVSVNGGSDAGFWATTSAGDIGLLTDGKGFSHITTNRAKPTNLINFFQNKVVIGTDDFETISPKDSHTLFVDGGITTKEVWVRVRENWLPDFVFDQTYKRITLKETEDYINKNHHLPNIPSAAEIEKEGMDLGKMNALLLQKIEELTLELIEMKNEIDTMKAMSK